MKAISSRPALVICAWVAAIWIGSAGMAAPEATTSAPDHADRALSTAHGLLGRGLNDLAAAGYREFLKANPAHPKANEAHYGLAVAVFRQQRWEDALAELRTLNDPQFAFAGDVAEMSGECLLSLNRPAEAVEAFRKLTPQPDHVLADDAAAGLVRALFLLAEHDELERECQAFGTRWPDSPLRDQVELTLAASRLQRSHVDRAADGLAALMARSPDAALLTRARLMLADCRARQSRWGEAAEQYAALLKGGDIDHTLRLPAAMGLARAKMQLGEAAAAADLLARVDLSRVDESSAAVVASLRGQALVAERDYKQALQLLEPVAKRADATGVEAAFWSGRALFLDGRYAECSTVLRRLMTEHPNSPFQTLVMHDLAAALYELKQYNEAGELARRFLERFPDDTATPHMLRVAALIDLQRGEFVSARGSAERLLSRYAKHPLAAEGAMIAADAEYQAGNFAVAANAYKRALTLATDPAVRAHGSVRLGLALHRAGRSEEAAEVLSQAVDTTTGIERGAVLLSLADIACRAESWPVCEGHAREAAGLLSDAAPRDEALFRLGLSLARQGRSIEALAVFDDVLARDPGGMNHVQTMFERAQALVALGRIDEASTALEQLRKDAPSSEFAAAATRQLGAIALQRNEFARAAGLLEKATDDPEAGLLRVRAQFSAGQFADADHAAKEWLDRHPDHAGTAEAQALRALSLARSARCADAWPLFDALSSGSLQLPDDTMRGVVELEQGRCARVVGRTDDASKLLRSLIDSPRDAAVGRAARLELVDIEIDAERFDTAAQLLKPVLGSPPEDSSAGREFRAAVLYRAGVVEYRRGDYVAAAERLATFLNENPGSELALSAAFFCGDAYLRANRSASALPYLRQAVEIDTANPLAPRVWLRLGDALAAEHDWSGSHDAFADHIRRFPQGPQLAEAQFGTGWAKENLSEFEPAIDAYRRVTEQQQGSVAARAQFQIGECLFALHRHEEAATELLKVDILYAYPEWSAAALFEAGRCFAALGRGEDAARQFAAVTKRFPDSPWAKRAAQQGGAAAIASPSVGAN